MREHDARIRRQRGRDRGPHGGGHLVGQQHRAHTRAPRGVGERNGLEPGGARTRLAPTTRAGAHHHRDAGVAQVEGLRLPLVAEAQDGDRGPAHRVDRVRVAHAGLARRAAAARSGP